MVKRPARLQFTEDDLSSDAVKKAAGKADKAATKAEKAVDRLAPKKHRKLRQESDISADRTKKLRFDKAKSEEIPPTAFRYQTGCSSCSGRYVVCCRPQIHLQI